MNTDKLPYLEDELKNSITRDRMLEIREFFNRSGCFVDHNLIELIHTAVQALKELPGNKNITT